MKSLSTLTKYGRKANKSQNAYQPPKVVFSSRAYSALLSEVLDEIETETGGVFLGYWANGVWQVVESVDPGPKSLFELAYFEYDQDYVNHLINKVSRIYKEQLDLIGLWHRHPGSFDRFSATDDETNVRYASLSEHGAISALVNIDPGFRLTVYQVNTEPLHYEKIQHTVLDSSSDRDQAPYADSLIRIRQIENESGFSLDSEAGYTTGKMVHSEIVAKSLKSYLAKRSVISMANESIGTTRSWNDEDYVLILAAIEDDAQGLENIGIGLTVQPNDEEQLALVVNDGYGKEIQIVDGFRPMDDGKILFALDGQTFFYKPGLIVSAFEETPK